MSVLVGKNTKLMVQGITGSEGSFHTRQIIEYGTNVVAGVTPGKGGTMFDEKVPIFNTCREAVEKAGANTSVIFVPPPFALDAIRADGHHVVGFVCAGHFWPAITHVTDDLDARATSMGASAESELSERH